MKKVAFVSWSEWFKRTGSTAFFIELLKTKFNVTEFSRPNWFMKDNVPAEKLNATDFDAIVFWFVLPPARYLAKLKCKNIIWVPMYDGTKGLILAKAKFLFYKLFNLKVICFSKKLADELSPFFTCTYAQYFPKPQKLVKVKGKKLFFWERRGDISWKFVADTLITSSDFDSITVKQSPDGLYKNPEKVTHNKHIKVIDTWMSKAKYTKLLRQHNYFIAPRLKEGIGFSFLEAMAMGQIVIAHNDSTMNEYVKNGETGYLFDYPSPQKVMPNDFETMQKKVYEFITTGYKKWLTKKEDLLKWIEK